MLLLLSFPKKSTSSDDLGFDCGFPKKSIPPELFSDEGSDWFLLLDDFDDYIELEDYYSLSSSAVWTFYFITSYDDECDISSNYYYYPWGFPLNYYYSFYFGERLSFIILSSDVTTELFACLTPKDANEGGYFKVYCCCCCYYYYWNPCY